jgi:hypothetical protein
MGDCWHANDRGAPRCVSLKNGEFYMSERMHRHPLRDRIVARIKAGDFASVREIMAVASLPRQTVNRWLREHELDLGVCRLKRLAKMHEQEERYLSGLPPRRKPSKALLHWLANRYKRQWDQRHGAQQEGVQTSGSRDSGR